MSIPSRFFSVGIVLLFSAGAVWADNWERFRGPNGSGIAGDKNIPITFSATENVLWKAKIGAGHCSPILWGERVFLQAASADVSKRALFCLDAGSGKVLWERGIPASQPKQSLRKDTSLASATATTDGTAVYVPFWDGKDVILAAYDFSGEKLWDRNFGQFISQHGAGASPIVYKDLLIFAVDKDAFKDTAKKTGPVADPSRLYALDKKTGKTVWEAPRTGNRACYSAPFLLQTAGGAPELVFTSMTALTSYEPESGKVNWEWKWTGVDEPLRTVNSTTYANGIFLACTGDGDGRRQMVAVGMNGRGKSARPEKLWLEFDKKTTYKKTPYVPCMLTRGEHVYFVGDYGHVACLDPKTGKKLWFEQIREAQVYASPLLIDGKIYACTDQGDVVVFPADPGGFKELARNKLDEVIRATPAVANGRLYIRTAEHLYCIGKK